MNFLKKYMALFIIGVFYSSLDVSANNSALESKTTENILESYGVDKKTQEELKKSYQEVKKAEASILKHHHNIEVHREAARISTLPKYNQNRDDDLKKKVIKELKISDFEASRMLRERDLKVLKIWDKMLEDERKEIYEIAEASIREREYTNMTICSVLRGLYNNQPEDTLNNLRLLYKQGLISRLNISEQDAEVLIKNDDPKALEVWTSVMVEHDIRMYNQAKFRVLQEQEKYDKQKQSTELNKNNKK